MTAPRSAIRAVRPRRLRVASCLARRCYADAAEPQKPSASSSQTRYVRPDNAASTAPPSTARSADVKGKGRAEDSVSAVAIEPTKSATASEASPATLNSASSTPEASTSAAPAPAPEIKTPAPTAIEVSPALRNPFLSLNTSIPFDTETFVRTLVEAGIPRPRAEVLLDATRGLTQRELRQAQAQLISKVSMENDEFLYKAAQAELRSQVQEDTRENVLAQKSANARAHRKIDLLRQSLNESMEASKSEYKYEIQQTRHETNSDFKQHDMRWSTVANRITIVASEARYIDERLKFFFAVLVLATTLSVCVLCGAVIVFFPHQAKLPTIEDLGVNPLPDERQVSVYDTPLMLPERRVGEEERDM